MGTTSRTSHSQVANNTTCGVSQPVARGVPTQLIVLALVAVIIIPGVGFAGLLLTRYAQSEQSAYELQALDVARAGAAVLDMHLTGLRTSLQTLSTSHLLTSDDLAGFYGQASKVRDLLGADVRLRYPDGSPVFDTNVPFGTPLPPAPLTLDAEAISTGGAVVSDVHIGSGQSRPTVVVVLPVMRGSEVKYLLSIDASTDQLHDVLAGVVSPDWVIGVGDRTGVYVTRSARHAEFTGTPGVPEFLARATGHHGTFVGKSAFGDDVLVGYTRTAVSDWLVAASIKHAVLEAPLRRALYYLVGTGAVTLVGASLIAMWLWRWIAEPLEGLVRVSRQIGTMTDDIPVHTRLRELQMVRDALAAASREVREQRERLEENVAARTRELELAYQDLKAQNTARERVEGQLRQIQKMEAIGQLTGGIAHDFNNMLTIIVSSLGLLYRRLPPDDTALRRLVDSAMEGANRAATLTKRLLDFSRQQALAPAPLDINHLVAGMSELLQRTLGEPIQIETALDPALWMTFTDSSQLENAIVNLAVNARDAMPAGGHLTIETTNATLDQAAVAAYEGVEPGDYVLISVSDTGVGMSADALAQAFEPFFTTKKIGMGTGLGLSQVYGFVKQSKGHVTIYSEPGHGTMIKLYLPRYTGPDLDRSASAEARPHPQPGLPHEVILVVEDDESLRLLTAETLQELGYTVHQAERAEDALKLLNAHPEIVLLFTDISMPDINGRELADEAVRLYPSLRVLFTTGFARSALVQQGVLDSGRNFVPKPYLMDALAAKIRQVLSDQHATTR